MATDAFGLTPRQLLGLIIIQCITQGCLVSLMGNFLAIKSSRPAWFKIFVIFVNLLCITQTTISVIQGLDLLEPSPYRESLVLAYTATTTFTSVFVQLFFIDRCWRIFNKRTWPTLPLLILVLAGLVSGTIMVVLKAKATEANLAAIQDLSNNALQREFEIAARRLKTAMTVWVFSSFVLDLVMTTTTVIFLRRSRTGLTDHRNVFTVIWQIMWASAAPPLVLMIIAILGGYITKSVVISTLAVGSLGKFHTLSLMINLVGQDCVRQQFARSQLSHSSTLRVVSHIKPAVVSEPLFAHTRTVSTFSDLGETSSTSSQSIHRNIEGPRSEVGPEGGVNTQYVPVGVLQQPQTSYAPRKVEF